MTAAPIENLSGDNFYRIWPYLDLSSLHNAKAVCKTWIRSISPEYVDLMARISNFPLDAALKSKYLDEKERYKNVTRIVSQLNNMIEEKCVDRENGIFYGDQDETSFVTNERLLHAAILIVRFINLKSFHNRYLLIDPLKQESTAENAASVFRGLGYGLSFVGFLFTTNIAEGHSDPKELISYGDDPDNSKCNYKGNLRRMGFVFDAIGAASIFWSSFNAEEDFPDMHAAAFDRFTASFTLLSGSYYLSKQIWPLQIKKGTNALVEKISTLVLAPLHILKATWRLSHSTYLQMPGDIVPP